MKQGKNWVLKLIEQADLPSDTLPGLPVVEIAGQRRVLIENHMGVSQYGMECICVKVKFGQVKVSGDCLELAGMTKGRLMIVGRIDRVELIRRNSQ